MDVDIEKMIDEVWNSSLNRISKKESSTVRPSLGDDIDLYIPQTRTLLLLRDNPNLASLIYNSSYDSAKRNAYIIMRKLGMPADYFWAFEYWSKERAFDTLQRVINRVFTAMMDKNKEGELALEDVDAEHVRFTFSFKDCAECAGIVAERYLCYYHAAMFAGIMAALIGKDTDGVEVECHARGNDKCIFLIGRRDDKEIGDKVNNYLANADIVIKMDDRLSNCLCGHPIRGMGNMVNIGYYQLMIGNCMITNPALFSSSSFDAGIDYGAHLADVITKHFAENKVDVIKKYYNQLRHLDVRMIETGDNIDIVLVECAEVAAVLQRKELLSFLFGELQGLASKLMNRNIVYKESWFEGNDLRVRLSPEV